MSFPYLTSKTAQLLQSVWPHCHTPSSDPVNKDAWPALIAQIAASGERAAIPCIFRMLFDSSVAVAQSASDALHLLLSGIPDAELATFDRDIRDLSYLSYWYDSAEWRSLKPFQVEHLPKTISSQVSVFGLASFHPSGYVREAALVQLNQFKDGSELPFLLVRLNDWVDQIRESAAQAVRERLIPQYVAPFLRSIALVIRLNELGRSRNDEIVTWTFSQLLQPQHQPDLTGLIADPDPAFRRKCFHLALQASRGQCKQLIEAGLVSPDFLIRYHALRQANPAPDESEWDRMVRLAERDRFMPIRRWALITKVERNPGKAESDLNAALIDRHASLRALAQFYLKKQGKTDLATVYRLHLAESKNQAVALAGLGETGSHIDLPLVRPYLHSQTLKERLAAVRTFVKLVEIDVVDDLLALLPDDRPPITRAVRTGLATRLSSIDPKSLWALLRNEQRVHVRRAVASLLSKLGTWTGLPFLLRLVNDNDAEIVTIAKRTIRSRFGHVHTKPNSAEKQMLDDAVADPKLAGDPFVTKELNWWLQSRGIRVQAPNL